MNLDLTEAQRVLACLGDPSRFRIVAVLADGDCCVTEIAAHVGLSQSCTTRHLQVLLRRDIVTRVRQGKRVLFHLRHDDPAMALLLEWALLRSPGPGPRTDREAGNGANRHQDGPHSTASYRAMGGSHSPTQGRVPRPSPSPSPSVESSSVTRQRPEDDPTGEAPSDTSPASAVAEEGELEDYLL